MGTKNIQTLTPSATPVKGFPYVVKCKNCEYRSSEGLEVFYILLDLLSYSKTPLLQTTSTSFL